MAAPAVLRAMAVRTVATVAGGILLAAEAAVTPAEVVVAATAVGAAVDTPVAEAVIARAEAAHSWAPRLDARN